ncbi:transposase [Porphyromonas asaccharolytica]
MKEEKSTRGRKGYPLDFKWRVIDDLLATGDSIATTSQRYGITTRTIRNWLRTFGVELPNQSTSTMSKTNKNKAVDPAYAELKRENARLKAALFQAESKALVNKTLLEEVLNRYHIDLKKKTDLQP